MLLSPDLHAHLRMTPIDNSALAAQAEVIDLLIPDIQPLATRFPIVVTDDGGLGLKALITPSDTDNLFAEHTPVVWRHYPLMLTSLLRANHPLKASTPNVREIEPPVAIDTDAPHFQLDRGFKLFENDEPTPFLKDRIARMEVDAVHEQRTLALLELLSRAEVLEPTHVRHQGQKIACYLVNDKALSTNLDKAATDSDSIGQAVSLALAIADSQKGLKVERSTD